MNDRVFLFVVLVVMGAGWGATQPLSKVAVSEGYRHLGLIFWQLVIGAACLGLLRMFLPGRRWWPQTDLRAMRVYLIIALVGTVFPNAASFEAIRHLPSGLISILLSLVPLFAFPIALALKNEAFAFKRAAGLMLGLIGVLLIVTPEASLPTRAMIIFIPLALIAPLFYAAEGNIVARWGTAGLDPIEVLFGASIVGALITLPFALGSGHFIDPRMPWGAPDFALVTASLIHVCVYTAYVWLVGRAGAVFAVQVSYLVTGFGVFWAILFLDEQFSGWVWVAMLLILSGVALVQPRPRLDKTSIIGEA